LGGFLSGLGHGVADPIATLGGLVGLHGGLKDNWSHLVSGAAQAFTEPVALVEALVDVQDARAGDWGRWLGTVVPTVGLTAVTDGAFLEVKAPEVVTELALQQARFAEAARLVDEAQQARVMEAALRGERWSTTVPGTLSAHERLGGHTLSKHVSQTYEQLLARVEREGRSRASSFLDRQVAEQALADVLERRALNIEKWLAKSVPVADPELAPTKVFSTTLGRDVCLVVHDTGEIVTASRVLMVLKREDTALGYRILSAYCEP
jgi:DNA-binding transcriptional ArsR family regulator